MLNYKIFGCHNILSKSSIGDYFKNIGFYLGAIITLYNIISFFIFFCFFLPEIRYKVYRFIPNDLYLYKKFKKLKNNKISNLLEKNNNSLSNPSNKKKNKVKSFNKKEKIKTKNFLNVVPKIIKGAEAYIKVNKSKIYKS